MMGFWYHFAIMFEALFILSAVDAVTRVARFQLSDALGNAFPKFKDPSWHVGAWATTGVVVAAWGSLLLMGVTDPRGGIKTLYPLFGIANQLIAAVALLVAIFKARPSPFYVMDEVEAALDDTNLGRLLEIFTELRRSSQLIIITHQKRTMEVADALYGITMRDGVTKAVSQRLAQPDRGTAVTPDV